MSETKIPETLREKLSAAGKKGIKKMTPEQMSKGGKHSWRNRVKRAREEEEAKKSAEETQKV